MHIASLVIAEAANWDEPRIVNHKLNKNARAQVASIMGDALIFVTALALFVLKALHFNVPTAALACFGVLDTLVIGGWILLLSSSKVSLQLSYTKNLLKAAFGNISKTQDCAIVNY